MSVDATKEQLIGRLKRLSDEYVEARLNSNSAIMGRLMTDMAETRAQLLSMVGVPADEKSEVRYT